MFAEMTEGARFNSRNFFSTLCGVSALRKRMEEKNKPSYAAFPSSNYLSLGIKTEVWPADVTITKRHITITIR